MTATASAKAKAKATPPPRRHRRANREAERNHLDRIVAVEAEILGTLGPVEIAGPKVRVPLRERPMLPTTRPLIENPKDELAWARQFAKNRVKHHATHSDLHARLFACATGRGIRRLYIGLRDYLKMPHADRVLDELVIQGRREDHRKQSIHYKEVHKKRQKRLPAFLGGAGVALLVVLFLLSDRVGWRLGPALFILLSAGALAIYGRSTVAPPNHPRRIDGPASPWRVAKTDPRPTTSMVWEAFKEAGIPDIVCEIDPHREGPGWETIVRIPVGQQTFKDAAERHAAIAGNLGNGSECLFLSPIRGNGGSEKHVRVWWADEDPFAGDPPPHPLLDPQNVPADLWNSGLPIGLDSRGTIARIAVVDTPFVGVIGLPGAGKTFLFFDISVGIGADPLWDQDCFSFKASDDFAPIKPLVKACGGTYDYGTDKAAFDRFYKYLVRMQKEVVERNKRLGSLPIHLNPNGKVERNVAADPKNGQRPRVVLVDEIITAIDGDPRILPALEELARTVRSLNWVFVFGAQFADSDTFKNLQKLFGATVCFSVKRWQDSKGALGSDHVPNVADASTIPPSAKGVAILAGAIEDPTIGPRPAFKFRSFNINRQLLADHVTRMLATTRSGQASARVDLEKPDPEIEAFRAKVAELFQPGETALTCMELGRRMGLGTGPRAGRDFGDLARKNGLEPQVDTSGKATGSRNASFIALDQLTESA